MRNLSPFSGVIAECNEFPSERCSVSNKTAVFGRLGGEACMIVADVKHMVCEKGNALYVDKKYFFSLFHC